MSYTLGRYNELISAKEYVDIVDSVDSGMRIRL